MKGTRERNAGKKRGRNGEATEGKGGGKERRWKGKGGGQEKNGKREINVVKCVRDAR
jgi:hypothetical protein